MALTTARTIFPNNNNINMERFIRDERFYTSRNKNIKIKSSYKIHITYIIQ